MRQKPIVEDISSRSISGLILPSSTQFQIEQDFLKAKQEEVESYNREVLENKNVAASILARKYFNQYIVVRLFQEDYADKALSIGQETSLLTDTTWTKKRNLVEATLPGQQTQLIDNPLPYVFEGVVVAMDSSVEEKHPEIKIGKVVQTIQFDLKSDRYYAYKNKRDYGITLDNLTLSNYEGYALVHPSMLESVSETRLMPQP